MAEVESPSHGPHNNHQETHYLGEKRAPKFDYKAEVPEADWTKGPHDVRPSLQTSYVKNLSMNQSNTLDCSGTYLREEGILAILGPLRENGKIKNVNFNSECRNSAFYLLTMCLTSEE